MHRTRRFHSAMIEGTVYVQPLHHTQRRVTAAALIAAGLAASAVALPPLPPPPFPAQNLVTEPKRILGKILFWEEQLSSDNTIACGTCHIPSAGGTDPRVGRNPGRDQLFNTADDVLGSPGVVARDANQNPVADPLFGFEPQVTRRFAPSVLMAAYSDRFQFWDGRRGGVFVNPETGVTTIFESGALENQALEPILNKVEMGHLGRTWAQVRAKLQGARPLAMASDIPADIAPSIQSGATYPQLFAAAFGTPDITAERIAFAIATYERTLIPNQSPWDRFNAGDQNALTPAERRGLDVFNAPASQCTICHTGAQFTTHDFLNIGLRPPVEDTGRQEVSGLSADRGKFRTPSLRNVGLQNRFMHNGRLTTLEQVVDFYRNIGNVQFADNRDPVMSQISITASAAADLVEFLRTGLTDPRVAAEVFPFDRPRLRSELLDGDMNCDGAISVGDIAGFVLVLTNPAAYASEYPQCSAAAADLNLDAVVSVGDIGPFVALLTGG